MQGHFENEKSGATRFMVSLFRHALDHDVSSEVGIERAEHIQERRFSRAARPAHGNEFTLADRETHSAHGLDGILVEGSP